jgi:hypothetical protein
MSEAKSRGTSPAASEAMGGRCRSERDTNASHLLATVGGRWRPVRRALVALAAAGVLVAAPDPVAAQPASISPTASAAARPMAARLEAIPDARVRAAVSDVLADARTRGLPLEPLVAKAREGVEKQAPAVRIEAAVRAMAARLASAQGALAPALSDAEVTAGADALAVGVPADVLQRLRGLAPRRSTAVSLGVLSQLVSRGVPTPQAAGSVARLVQQRATDAQLLALGRAVQDDISTGVSATTALALRTQALVAALPPLLAPPVGAASLDAPTRPARP